MTSAQSNPSETALRQLRNVTLRARNAISFVDVASGKTMLSDLCTSDVDIMQHPHPAASVPSYIVYTVYICMWEQLPRNFLVEASS